MPLCPPARPSRLLALLHEDLHPPGLLQALGALASTQLILGGAPPGPGTLRLASVLSRPRRGGIRQKVGVGGRGHPRSHGGSQCPQSGCPWPPPQSSSPPPQDESFTFLPDGSLRSLGVPTPPPEEDRRSPSMAQIPGSPRDSEGRAPSHPLTFRLQLSAAERAARAAVSPPYQLSPPK